MAISKIAGQMLQSTLARDGNNLAFTDTANTTPTLYLDIANTRVGINTDTPAVELTVQGDLSVTGNIVSGNITGNDNGTVHLDNLTISNTTISTSLANGNITLTPTGDQLVIISGTSGLVIPNGTSAQRPGYPSYSTTPVGTFRLNTGLNQIEAWDGSAWVGGGGGSSGNVTITDQQITPDGVNDTYTLVEEASQSSVLVSINGTGQLPGVAYTVTGNSITFGEIPLTSDIIDIRFLAAAVGHDIIYNNNGNASVFVGDNSNITFKVSDSNVVTITSSAVVDISASQSLKLPSYTVAQTSNIASPSTGQIIYVSNGDTGNPCLAVYSGGAWKRISFGANIST